MAWVIGIVLFLFLLFAFPKAMGILLLATAVSGVALYLYSEAETKRVAQERGAVRLTAKVAKSGCTADYSIEVSIFNGSQRVIEKVVFRLEAHRPNHSTAVASDSATSDRILNPLEAWVGCWRIPTNYGTKISDDVNSLVWSANMGYVNFRD
jgi:hypothetical protein